MDKVLIKRFPSKGEFPKVNGKYWCKFKGLSLDTLYQQEWILEFGGFGDNGGYDFWLEEIQLPNSEELEDVMNTLEENDNNSANDEWLAGANYILNKLK